jgi:hypothetical protein
MKNQEEFDHLVQKRLENKVVAPPSFVWQNIEAELRKNKKKRPAFWWMSGAALLLAGGLGVYMQKSPIWATSSSLTTAKSEVIANTQSKESAIQNTQNQTSMVSTSYIAPIVQNNTVPTFDKNDLVNHLNTTQIGNKSINFVAKGIISKSFADFEINKINESEVLIPVNNASESTLEIVNVENLVSSPAISLEVQNEPISSTFSLQSIDLLTTKNILLANKPTPYLNIKPIKPFWRKKNSRNCYDFSSHDAVFMLEAYFSPLLMQKTLDSIPTISESGLIKKRTSTESNSIALSTGVRGALILGPFVFRAGLNYNQFTEVFKYADKTAIQVTSYYEIVDGVRVEVKPPTTEVGKREIINYNRFYMLDIPILAGFEVRKHRMGVSLNGGISTNLFFGKRGEILDKDGNLLKIKGNTAIFKKNVGFSALADAQIFYHYNAQTRLFVEPSYQKILKSVASIDYSLKQNYQMWGLKLGVARILD